MRQLLALLLSAILLSLCSGCGESLPGKDGSKVLEAGPPTSTAGTSASVEAASAPSASTAAPSAAAPLCDFYGMYTFKEVSVLSPLSS